MRKTCLNMVYELACADERIFFVGSDLGYKTLSQFRENLPGRFLMEGINEAQAVGMAAGLALEGHVVYVNTIGTFLTRRAYEQVILDVCLHNVNVRLIGNGGGLVYAPLGSTHLAFEDLAAFRALPNMTIVAPADAEEMRRLMPLTVDHPGPMYIRLGKGTVDPVVTPEDQDFAIGRGYLLRQGGDALMVTTGVCLKHAQAAAEELAGQGIEAAILHLPTVKPLDQELLLAAMDKVPAVVTIEEGTILGGLGGAVAEILAEQGYEKGKKFKRLGVPDIFPDKFGYGAQDAMMSRHGIDGENLAATVRSLVAG